MFAKLDQPETYYKLGTYIKQHPEDSRLMPLITEHLDSLVRQELGYSLLYAWLNSAQHINAAQALTAVIINDTSHAIVYNLLVHKFGTQLLIDLITIDQPLKQKLISLLLDGVFDHFDNLIQLAHVGAYKVLRTLLKHDKTGAVAQRLSTAINNTRFKTIAIADNPIKRDFLLDLIKIDQTFKQKALSFLMHDPQLVYNIRYGTFRGRTLISSILSPTQEEEILQKYDNQGRSTTIATCAGIAAAGIATVALWLYNRS